MGFHRQLALALALFALDLGLLCGLFFMAGGRKREYYGEIGVSAGERSKNAGAVALTFDDGPDRELTGKLLDGLRERGVCASFFLLGNSVDGNEELVSRMSGEGHLVGVHGLSHTDLTKKETAEALRQLDAARKKIASAAGREPEYMRPPYGAWNDSLSEAADMEPVFWSLDSLDWKLQDAGQIVERVVKTAENGDIILMHEGFASSVEAAFEIIDILQARGYTFVTVDELLID